MLRLGLNWFAKFTTTEYVFLLLLGSRWPSEAWLTLASLPETQTHYYSFSASAICGWRLASFTDSTSIAMAQSLTSHPLVKTNE